MPSGPDGALELEPGKVWNLCAGNVKKSVVLINLGKCLLRNRVLAGVACKLRR